VPPPRKIEVTSRAGARAAVVSIALLAAFLGIWHLATRSTSAVATMTPEYAKLMGLTATQGKSAMPGPLDVGAKLWEHLKRPFYDNGPNDKGLGIQLGYSIARVALGYLIAVVVAIPLGFLVFPARIYAWVFIGLWFLLQLVDGVGSPIKQRVRFRRETWPCTPSMRSTGAAGRLRLARRRDVDVAGVRLRMG